MATFTYTTYLPFNREDVFDWYCRPGALTRLHPPFAGRVIAEPSHGISEGSESQLGINMPGLFGVAFSAAADIAAPALSKVLPGAPRGWVHWRARHTDVVPHRGFADVMVSGPASSWRHDRSFDDDGEGTLLHETVEYELPVLSRVPARARDLAQRRFEEQLRRIFAYRERQTIADLAFHQQHGRLRSQLTGAGVGAGSEAGPEPITTVAVSGSSGLIGAQVCALLGGAGFRVRRLVRGSADDVNAADGEIPWDPNGEGSGGGELNPEALRDVDAVIHLAGHPLASRFTDEHRQKVWDSRVQGTRLIAETLAKLETEDPRGRVLVSGSAIGYYGATAEQRETGEQVSTAVELLTEDSPVGKDFLAEVCQAWEASTQAAADAGVRVAMIRTGIVQTPAGGAMQQQLPLFAAGVGGPLGEDQWQSWISIDDIAGLIVHLALQPAAEGPVNGVAPSPVTAKQYATILGAVMHRPAAIPVPSFGPKLLLGKQGAEELVQADQRVSSQKAEHLGYAFRHPTLQLALRHILGA